MIDEIPEVNTSVAIHQATGMIAAQLRCDVDEAFARLTIRAAGAGQSPHEMALDVLDRVVRFHR
jgi:hypothetical protein